MLKAQQLAHILDERYLNLILFPTEQCNFRCTYCYEDFKAKQMEPTVVEAIKQLVKRRAASLDVLDISWFGGEPLAAKKIVYDISQYVFNLSQEMPHFSYQANMTTNAYLLDRTTAEILVSSGVNFFQVSLDGPQEVHDRSRLRADGSGTFSRIWSNLLAIRDSNLPLTIMLRIHFSPDTYLKMDPLIEAINEEFGGDRRFIVYFKAISRLGGPNDGGIPLFSAAMEDETKMYLEQKLRYKEQVYNHLEDGMYVCYASQPNSLAIRSNGDLAKCTVALYDDRNRIGKLNEDGTITVDQSKVRFWMRGLASLSKADLACPFTTMDVEARTKEDGSTRSRKVLPMIRS
jgi:uncharacterized protein